MGAAPSLGSISRLGIGCWQFGDMGSEVVPEAQAAGVVAAALDAGVNHFDTAQGYGAGRSEAVLGRALAGKPQAFVATKMNMAGAAETRAGVRASRERLGRDCIDLFYIHWPREGMDPAPMMEALEEARSRGWVRYVGVSNFSVQQMRDASRAGRIDAHQLCYNLLWRFPEEDVIPYCRENGIVLVSYSSLAQGLLSGAIPREPRFAPGDPRASTVYYDPEVWPHVRDGIEELAAIAAKAGRPLSHLALRWLTDSGTIASVLVGSRNRDHLAGNLTAFEGTVDPSAMRLLDEASRRIQRHIPRIGNIFKYYP
ncbi:MAG: aldo/keto reductase [Spirochaetes bacterium]|nr:aldo/keto reductase [Spirochaetota bacterium]